MEDVRLKQRLAQEKKLDEVKQRNKDEYHKFRTALEAVSRDANGIIVLRHLAKICGFWKSSIVITGDGKTMNGTDLNSVLVNEGRRSVYLDLRRPMSDETRRLIESKGDEDHV